MFTKVHSIKIKPIAIGIDVVPTDQLLINLGKEGEINPLKIPSAIAKNTHRVM